MIKKMLLVLILYGSCAQAEDSLLVNILPAIEHLVRHDSGSNCYTPDQFMQTWSQYKQECRDFRHFAFNKYDQESIDVCDRWIEAMEYVKNNSFHSKMKFDARCILTDLYRIRSLS